MTAGMTFASDAPLPSIDDSPLAIEGRTLLNGSVIIGGSKHSILHILGALWLLSGRITLRNVPNIWDVQCMLEIYRTLGMAYRFEGGVLHLHIDPAAFSYTEQGLELACNIRSSILLLGSLLAKTRHVKFPLPTGDRIGNRPFAEFFAVLEYFGISYSMRDGWIEAWYDKPFTGDKSINLFSQGNNRTALAIILAAANRGQTTLLNPLPQPEILELCSFISIFICPVDIEYFQDGSLKIVVNGRGEIPAPCEGSYTVGPDKCELGFWIAAAAITHGRVECRVLSPSFTPISLGPLAGITVSLLEEFGIALSVQNSHSFIVDGERTVLKPVRLIVPHNKELTTGLCIDVCPQFIPLMTFAQGCSVYRDGKYGCHRVLAFLSELRKLGLVAAFRGELLEVQGGNELHGAQVIARDIRGGATLLIAALAACGTSLLDGVFHINRGYEGMYEKLGKLGASVERRCVK